RHHPSSKRFVLVKDAQFTVLPTKMPDGAAIAFAELRWDKQAKRRDGSWDYDRVVRSARFECPHCGGHITDNHRLCLDRTRLRIELGRHGEKVPGKARAKRSLRLHQLRPG